MTHPTYTQQVLSRYTLPRLKRIAAELGVTPTGDKRAAETWVNAIFTHQSAQLQKVDEKAIAQAQAIALEELRTVEVSFYDHEYYCGDKLIAAITHDHTDFVTQRWVVMVNGVEIHRAATPMLCDRYIRIHYKDGTLPVQEQNATDVPCSTGNEIMSQIFSECEQYGLELLDDGIYRDDVKLGEVGCSSGKWWFIRSEDETQQRILCDSALKAVWWLSMVDMSFPAETANEYLQYRPLEQLSSGELQQLLCAEMAGCEQLLDLPFEQLTAQDWQRLREYEPVAV
ncbi:MAG: hypothetical protein KME40_30295 [Komarekiella atlantica HA4396-MV6]|nr:hypothetical protein [Komarekiella atlantica HA4396-MV6]